jgi:glycosyltransferase involved in cell wall biosynthesis
MKLIIQIPCYNEEKTLAETVRDLPGKIDGIDEIEIMVIDDGSSDKTVAVAEKLGVHHIVRQIYNKGLAKTFMNGINHALKNKADIVVNTDGDNQYFGGDIEKLVRPIIEKKADMVVGCRPIMEHPEFNVIKKILQVCGSWVLRKISKTDARDAASGFRAFSKETCLKIFVHSNFSYCMETLIQAGNSGLKVASVDIRVNKKTRESRLFTNMFQYVKKSGMTILSMFLIYRPGLFFSFCGIFSFSISFLIGMRFLWLTYFVSSPNPDRTYIPSLILLSIFTFLGLVSLILGVFGELMKFQRKLVEELIQKQREHLF